MTNTLEKLIESYPNKGWCYNSLSSNPSITPEYVEKYIKGTRNPWNWGNYGLSINPSITLEFIEKHINKNWNWGKYWLSINQTITPKFIEKHIDKPWNWGKYGISRNYSITPEFIEKHIDKPWYWGKYGLSSNEFLKHDYFTSTHYIRKQQKIQFDLIEEELIMKTWHPSRYQEWCLDIEDLKELEDDDF